MASTSGTVSENPDGSFTFQPAQHVSGPVTLSYDVIDGKGGSVSLTRTITLTAVSDAPTLAVSAASGDEDSAIALPITPLLVDLTETISAITISDIPVGSSLSNTAGDVIAITNGVATLTQAQLAGLKITPHRMIIAILICLSQPHPRMAAPQKPHLLHKP
jgi:hypothetical protein